MEALMNIISEDEERIWRYLLTNRSAEAEDIAAACGVSFELAQFCINRIGTPREILLSNTTQEAVKDDSGKAPYHLIAPELLEATAQVLAFGAYKYEPRNWEKGMDWSRPFSALMRHMWAWWRGEAKDPETGMSHLWHAACCIMFLVAYEDRETGNDDRPKKVLK